MADTLNPKQELFVSEYLKDFSGHRAAISAGYSPGSADQTASRMLRMDKIKAALAKAKQKRIERVEVDAAEVLRLLHTQVVADPNDIYDDDGKLLPISQWPEGWRLLLTSLDVAVDGSVKARFSDRARLISLMGRHCDVNAYTKKIEVEAGDDLVTYLREAGERVRNRQRTDIDGNLIHGSSEPDSSR